MEVFVRMLSVTVEIWSASNIEFVAKDTASPVQYT